MISAEGQNFRVLTKEAPGVFGWSKDSSAIYLIRKNDQQNAVVFSLELQTGNEKIISDLGHLPDSGFTGFSLAPDGNLRKERWCQ